MNLETLLLVMAVVFAAVFNVILPWVKRLSENGQAGSAEPELRRAEPTEMTPTAMASLKPQSELQAEPQPESAPRRLASIQPAATVALAGTRPARRPLLGSRSAMRNGIVLAAVLGPCRAQTPFV